jgi:hypothetical protein
LLISHGCAAALYPAVETAVKPATEPLAERHCL